MARQPYNVNPSEKKIEVLSSYGGGMVTQAHPEKLRDDQFMLIENGDILAGGALENRGAYHQTNYNNNGTITGKTQGKFRYEDIVNGSKDLVAINGKLYRVVGDNYVEVPITNLSQFQTTRMVEGVQVRDKLYIATGSGLVSFDGTTAKLVDAYVPNGMEYLYIGSNGYAASPESAIKDVVGVSNTILALVPDKRYGLANTDIIFTAYVEKPSADVVEYQFETKLVSDTNFTIDKAWSTDKTFTKKFAAVGDFQVRVSLRKSGTTPVLSQYILPSYKVNSTPEEKPEPTINFDDLKLCNRIFVHYDRLYLYGDTNNPDQLYPSHLNKFDYFPRTNVVKLTDPLRGSLNSAVRYKNFLVCFTDGAIHRIDGMSPKEFTIEPVHTSLGAKFDYSVQVMKNYVVFVGNDNGVYILKSFSYSSSDKLNVERIDFNNKDVIKSELETTTNVISTIYNDQYYLYIENQNTIHLWRFYYDIGTWVRDKVPMTFATLDVVNNELTATSSTNGTIYTLTKDSVLDGVNSQFTLRIVTKDYNFGSPHHRKKIKQYQMIVKIGFITTILVNVYADDGLLTTIPLIYDYNQDSYTQKLKVQTSGRFRTIRTDTSILVKEPIQLIGFGFIFKENTPK